MRKIKRRGSARNVWKEEGYVHLISITMQRASGVDVSIKF